MGGYARGIRYSYHKRASGRLLRVSGGDGGESNSPSRRDYPGYPTGIVNSLFLPGEPLLTESRRASRFFFHHPYRRPGSGTSALFHPIPTHRGEAGLDVLPFLVRQRLVLVLRQLCFATCLMRVMATSACNPVAYLPCRNHASPFIVTTCGRGRCCPSPPMADSCLHSTLDNSVRFAFMYCFALIIHLFALGQPYIELGQTILDIQS